MSLSKPINKLVIKYFESLFNAPIKTKAITCSIISLCGNATSQYITDSKPFNQDSFMAFGLFGLLFGGTVPHFFYKIIEKLNESYNLSVTKVLFIERLIYTPLYQAFALYMLTRLEGKDHEFTLNKLHKSYWPILQANWKWITLATYLNIAYVPPMIRVLVVNMIGYFWAIYLAFRLRSEKDKKKV